MTDYVIKVNEIEEHQTLNDTEALEKIFSRARSAVVNGAKAVLARKEPSGKLAKFDEMDTLEALEKYKAEVFKYLSP